MSNEDRHLLYLRGFKIGACGGACKKEMFEYLDFSKGHSDGRKAALKAYRRACKVYKCELSPLRK